MPEIAACRRVRAVDFHAPWYRDRAAEMLLPAGVMHRKYWEHAIIAQVYTERVGSGGSCLGFGVGKEPLVAWMAARARVTATDLPDPGQWADETPWCPSGQHAHGRITNLPWRGICPESRMRRVELRGVDMNDIPPDLTGFSFTWSAGSFEHIGGLEAGLSFFVKQMSCLRPGGLAAHTTEFNTVSNDATLQADDLVLFRRRDLEELNRRLRAQGDALWPPDLEPGTTDDDKVVLDHPYVGFPHLSIRINKVHVTTSVLLVARRSGA